ncbi:MAG: TadE/TadG family type IV pilus assembly protein [Candidatus Dormibacteria bacterium]
MASSNATSNRAPSRRPHVVRHGRRLRRQRAQGMVETALALPVVVLLLFMTIDFGRAVYTWVMLGQDADYAARQIALPDNQASDCSAINATQTAGNGVTVSADPNSVIGNTDPSSNPVPYTTPAGANSGYLYLYPAQATASPPAQNCSNTVGRGTEPARPSGSVTALVTFRFVPWTPIASQLFPQITMTAQANEMSQY